MEKENDLPPTQPVVLKVEKAMTSAEIDTATVCPLRTPSFRLGIYEYDAKRQSRIERLSKCVITRREAQAKFSQYRDA